MKRRDLLKAAVAIPFLPGVLPQMLATAWAGHMPAARWHSRVRPGDAAWPSADRWAQLSRAVGGRLQKLESPFARCDVASTAACEEALAHLKNPYYIGDQPALTQTSGWAGAWMSQPSAYAVAAESTADVVAAVNFAREHHLRLVVKGGGHSYQGTSDAPDSLLVWTRHMNAVTMRDDFVPRGGDGKVSGESVVTVGAGAMWIDAYDAVTTHGGRYVQGGGCTTVGVAGLVQSGGFGSFSKNFGTAAANLLEAEIVTADGQVRIANAFFNPDLFWAIKGGGGGSIGILTQLTLRTHELPEFFGAVFGAITASTDEAYRALIAKAIAFYQSDLFNPHWGEQWVFRNDNTLRLSMVFQGITQQQARDTWAPFLEWVRAHDEYRCAKPVQILALPAKNFWDAEFFRKHMPSAMVADDRPGAPRDHVLWAGDQGQVGWLIHSYQSAWLPASLLQPEQQATFVDALFQSTRHWEIELHLNKGIAGASAETQAKVRDTAMNPDVLGAFALAILGGSGDPAYPGMPGAKIDIDEAKKTTTYVTHAMNELRRAAPNAGSYVSESDYFLSDWQTAFWGVNYPRLKAVKRSYDPDGLFFVHHGVGSESWSADGFTRITS